ncbi:MAG: hypothetical protein JW809_02450 [Pirellulales bacterium]|nr:hypothetical protein [Pirellulales bacterium]
MPSRMNRRTLLKDSLAATAAGALAWHAAAEGMLAEDAPPDGPATAPADALPTGRIGKLQISRIVLGGNLLTHYTHSRDLQYVYKLAAHYNTDEKILETLALAEQHGVNTLSMHNPPHPMSLLKKYRQQGGKIQWIICPTAVVEDHMEAYTAEVKELLDAGCEAIYLWGVTSDRLVSQKRIDLLAKAVEVAKDLGVPSGVGCHDLRVVEQCEQNKVPADFYIKTFHHHEYPSGPKPDQLRGPTSEVPAYWCKDPRATMDVMKTVEKPWFAFKVMAAGAIPPKDAFAYAFNNGADHILAGMFDFEIAGDVEIAKAAIAGAATRERPWRS